jgi:uncharacterized protein YjbJ (UPF0337 family)
MVNEQVLSGKWNEISGKIREKWGQLTDDDMQTFHGNATQLVGLIQRKTGEARAEVEKFLETVVPSSYQRVAEQVREYASTAYDSARGGVDKVASYAKDGYGEAERMVKSRPGTSVATAFGAGIVAGVVVALMLRSR